MNLFNNKHLIMKFSTFNWFQVKAYVSQKQIIRIHLK